MEHPIWPYKSVGPRIDARAAVGALIVVLGCACSRNFAPIRVSASNAIPEGHGLVFGKILFNGSPATSADIIIVPPGSTEALIAPLNDDATFCWHLPPGRAVLTSYRTDSNGGLIGAEFTVPAPGSTAYIGTLSIRTQRTSSPLSYMPRGIMGVEVEDHPDQSAVGACGHSVTPGQLTRTLMEIKRR